MNGTVVEVYRSIQINNTRFVMEIKKSKQADLESKKKSIFLFGLLTSLGLFFMAFEWASHDVNYDLPPERMGDLVEEAIPMIPIEIERPKPKLYKAPVFEEPIVDTFIVNEDPPEPGIVVVRRTQHDPNPNLEIDTSQNFVYVPAVDIEKIIDFAEEMPSYPGGERNLFKDLADNIKGNAAGISGKVYVEFVVEKDGTITHVKLKKGIHPLLDNQAINAVKELKKWNPGIQNHHPVRVRLVLPINYVVR